MEISLAVGMSILSAVISVCSFVLNRKDKSNKDTSEDAYHLGQIDTKLKNIEDVLAKIERKLDTYDKEIDEKIATAMKHHINEYHKGNR